MASIKLNWSGATASLGIKGYEISHKESTDSLWTTFPFITSSTSSGTYTWTGAEYNKNYNFRIRTKDNTDLLSNYKFVNISTIMEDNLPPTTVSSYVVNDVQPESFNITFSGASDDYEIKGHEVSYKKTADSTYTTNPFIITSSGSFTTSLTGLSPITEYNIRVRTKDIFDVWSTAYFSITLTTDAEPVNSFNRSSSSKSTGTACGSLSLGSNLIYFSGILESGNVVYTNSSLTTPFNGSNRIWLVGSFDGLETYSVKISTIGVVTNMSLCI